MVDILFLVLECGCNTYAEFDNEATDGIRLQRRVAVTLVLRSSTFSSRGVYQCEHLAQKITTSVNLVPPGQGLLFLNFRLFSLEMSFLSSRQVSWNKKKFIALH